MAKNSDFIDVMQSFLFIVVIVKSIFLKTAF